jgi:hypothetical protein
MNSIASLHIIDKPKCFLRLLDTNHVHQPGRIRQIGTHFAVDLDEALFDDLLCLVISRRVLKTIAQKDDQWQALAQLMRSGRRTRCECSYTFVITSSLKTRTRQLVEHPVFRRRQTFQMMLRSARHFVRSKCLQEFVLNRR